jgi:hypothetical protein
MNRLPRLLVILALLFAAHPLVRGQYISPPPARPFPGLINEILRAQDVYLSAWDVGVNVRLRREDKDDAGFTNAGSNWDFSERPVDRNNNHYYLTRVMPRVGYTAKWFTALVEGRSSYSIGDERYSATAPGNGLAERDGPIDLHQAYLFVGNHKVFPVSLKIGRQELVYGDQRLLGNFRWNNNARTFDAAKLRYQNALLGVDVFTGRLVYNNQGHFNRSYSADTLSGLYFNFPSALTNEVVEAYVYDRTVSRSIGKIDWSGVAAPFRSPAPQDLYTWGLRIRSKPLVYGPFDYGIELMHQTGNRTTAGPTTAPAAVAALPRLTQDAWAAVLQSGYTWTEHPWQPRFAVLYSYATGDKNSADGESQTFQNLFATTHLHYGYMDLNSLQNLSDLRFAFTAKPRANISLALESHFQKLDRTTDYWYNVAGVARNFAGAAAGSGKGYRINPSYSHDLGTEIDLVGGWTFTPAAMIEVGVSHYYRGDYIKESLASVGSKDASYVYTQLTLNF